MGFRQMKFEPIYDSAEQSIFAELINPLLKQAVSYKRGVGFFTSSWLELCLEGLMDLAEKKGRFTLITSPHLEDQDWEAFRIGTLAQKSELLHRSLFEQVKQLETGMNRNKLTLLAWLVADGILEVKIAVPIHRRGDFHDKYAIFEDEHGDKVAIHGSLNDSQQANMNGEGCSVFQSWIQGHEAFVRGHELRFDRMSSGQNDFYEIYQLPDAIREDIAKLRHREPRPYRSSFAEEMTRNQIDLPTDLNLYPFQEEAIQHWLQSGGRGLFEMATGTGKTITSLSAAVRLVNENPHLVIIIAVPFEHLVNQWAQEVRKFGFLPITCYGSSAQWRPKVKMQIQDHNKRMRNLICLVTTYHTGSSDGFLTLIDSIQAPILFIGDESHYLGSKVFGRLMKEAFHYRIGLSATPDRWFDDDGSLRLRQYFEKTVAEVGILDAIREGFLTPYRFYPKLVPFNEEEYVRYSDLSRKISLLLNGGGDDEQTDLVQRLLIQRARLVNGAEGKLQAFRGLLSKKIKQGRGVADIQHTLVYCAPGSTGEVVRILADFGLRAREFIHTVPGETRTEILKQFESGEIQVLVAIKCLDEGVDIPQTKVAYFLSSTTNPREFVQRRGRILRRSPGKQEAVIYDFYVTPPLDLLHEEGAKSLIKREMPRFAEFSDGCINEFEARETVLPLLREHDLLHLIDLKPWDVYRNNQNELKGEESYEE